MSVRMIFIFQNFRRGRVSKISDKNRGHFSTRTKIDDQYNVLKARRMQKYPSSYVLDDENSDL